MCLQKIEKHKLDMNLTEVEYALTVQDSVLFTADGRVDFRELVKDLASTFHTVLSCARSACETRLRCWAVWACAGGRFAAPPS